MCSRHLDNLSLRENSETGVGPLNTVRKVVVPLVEDSMVFANNSLSPCRSLYGSVSSSFRFLSLPLLSSATLSKIEYNPYIKGYTQTPHA